MRTTSLTTGALAPAVLPLILLGLSGAPATAQEKIGTAVTTAPLPPVGTGADWSWTDHSIDLPDEMAAAEQTPEEAPAPYLSASPSKSARAAVVSAEAVDTRVSRTANKDGSSSVTAAGSLRNVTNTEFGVDMSLAAARQGASVPDATPGTSAADGSGAAAWARTTIPGVSNFMVWDKGSVDVRVDPLQEQSRLGTTFTRQWTVMDNITASLSDAYAITKSVGGAEQWETGKTASVNFAQTGTSISVGTATKSHEGTWLPSVSASQSLFGPVTVTTSVADNGENLNKSITAGFRRNW
ncbi:hypothetical protein ABLE91_13070 [Aquabacter sp. CN5-332]|uniref:hypothetical protein n=1 Tax=Aquabacter sp. CN5-332 TaxID=3156608 RepID=UPI0032B59E9A